MNIKQEQDFLDFGNETESSFIIKPGYRNLKIGGVGDYKDIPKFSTHKFDTGSTAIKIYLSDNTDNGFTEMFYLSPKAIDRLKYFYNALFKESLTQKFKSADELAEFLTNKYENTFKNGVYHYLMVGGEIRPDGQCFSVLPFKNFVKSLSEGEERNFTEKEEVFFIKRKNI